MKCNTTIRFLRDIADIQTGPFGSQLHKEDYVEYGTPIVTVEHLGNRQFTEQNLPKVSDSDKERLKKYVLATGDIVFSRVGSVDRCSYVDEEHNGWMFSGRCLRVRPSEEIDSLYLYYYFCREETRQFVRNIAVGATMPSINTKLLGEVPVAVPDIQIQKAVSNILSKIDDKIELNNKINANLQQQADLLYNELFENELEFCELGSVIETTSGGTPSRKQLQFYENASILWMKSKELTGGFIYDTEEKINQIALAKTAVKLLPPHSILVAMYGATVGECGIVSSSMTCNQAICALLPNDKYPYTYLYQLIRHTKEQLKNMAVGSAQQNISQVLIKKMPIHSNQKNVKQFHVKAQPYFKMMELLTLENIKLVELRNTLIPKLMSDTINLDVNFYN